MRCIASLVGRQGAKVSGRAVMIFGGLDSSEPGCGRAHVAGLLETSERRAEAVHRMNFEHTDSEDV